MYRFVTKRDSGLGLSTALSVLLHVAFLGAVIWWQQFLPARGVETTYYVDLVNLPVENPAPGNPVATREEQEPMATQGAASEPSPPLAAIPPPKPVMALPSSKPVAKGKESEAFQERLAKLEGKADARRQADAIERLRSKVASQGGAGIPKGTGNQAGSDYTAYLHSRLKDAFRETISFQSKDPFVMLRLTVDADGRIARTRIEKSSGDKVFEMSVIRAVNLAEQTIVPPPGGKLYEGGFLFKPQGVSKQ